MLRIHLPQHSLDSGEQLQRRVTPNMDQTTAVCLSHLHMHPCL